MQPINSAVEKPIAPIDPSLQDQLDNYKAQLEEFTLTTHPELEDPDKLAEAAKDSLIQSLPIAVTVLHDLLDNPVPAIRMSAAKFIITATLNKNLQHDDESIADMFEKLGAVKQKAASKSEEKVAVAVKTS